MSLAALEAASGALWPYLVVVLIGFLPTEMWRMLAVWMARDLQEDSDILLWVRLVASALLAAVVAKMVLAPTGAMLLIPLAARIGGVLTALSTLMLFKKSVVAAVIAGEIVVIVAGLMTS